jgi:hypothetical protein
MVMVRFVPIINRKQGAIIKQYSEPETIKLVQETGPEDREKPNPLSQ